MCLAKAYLGGQEDTAPLLEYISSVEIEQGTLLITTVFGEQKRLNATIKSIDFSGGKLILYTLEDGLNT